MGLFSDIISAVGNGWNDLFGGGNSDNNKQKKNTPQQAVPSAVKLPALLTAPKPTPTPTPTPQPQSAPTQQPIFNKPIVSSNNITNIAGNAPDTNRGTPYTANNQPGYFKAIDTGADIGANVLSGLGQGAAKLVGSPLSAASDVARNVFHAPKVANTIDSINLPSKIGNSMGAARAQVDQSAKKEGINTPYQIGSHIVSTALMVPGAAEMATKLPVIGGAVDRGISAVPGLIRDSLSADGVMRSPESGIKPVDAPTGSVTTPNTELGAPESGVKAVTPPEPTPTQKVAAMPSEEDAVLQNLAERPAAPTPTPTDNVVPQTRDNAPSGAIFSGRSAPVPENPPTNANLLDDTGNPTDNLTNVLSVLKNNIENGRDYSGTNSVKELIDAVNGHQLNSALVARKLQDALEAVLGKENYAAVENALQTGTVDRLPPDQQQIAKLLQENHYQPSDALRAATDTNYVPQEHYSPQLRSDTVSSAARSASRGTGTLTQKVNRFSDLLQRSRLSQARTMGKFTDAMGKSVYGDPSDLGLVAKKDGTFVDQNGKTYTYSGATNQELASHGVQLQDLGNSNRIAAEDAQNLRIRTAAAQQVIDNPEKYNLSETPINKGQVVSIKDSNGESHDFYTDKKTKTALENAGITGNLNGTDSLPLAAWRAANSAVVQSIVLNPLVHGSNQLVQAVVASGLRDNGLGGVSLLKGDITDSQLYRFQEAGGYVPNYGKNSDGIISQMTRGVSKLNQKAMSAIDGNLRVRAFNSLTKGGMTDKEAAQMVNKFMGDRNTLSQATQNMTIFLHYFKTLGESAQESLVQGAKGHPGALINAGAAAAVWYGLNRAWQEFTGNPEASVHAPGVVGLGKQVVSSVNALSKGQFRQALSPFTNRVSPIISEGVQQLLNTDAYTGGHISTKPGLAGAEQRVSHALAATPLTNLVNNNGHSVPEKLGNMSGLYESHIKGDMAVAPNSPLAPVLNVKNAKNGSTVAFPKDFNGEQANQAVNNLTSTGLKYSTKLAAQFNAQSQPQQKQIVNAANDLKSVGITNASLIFDYAKLTPSEQTSYKQAVTQLNENGQSVSAKSIQEQLLADGNKQLAGKLNTAQPGSTATAQQALDLAEYKKSGSTQPMFKDGMVFQNKGDGKFTVMAQKDYDYQQADEGMANARSSNDLTGYADSASKMLDNISWQLQHGTETTQNTQSLIKKAIATQNEIAKYEAYGGFTKPKGAATWKAPTITGAYQYTPEQQKQYGGLTDGSEAIALAGAKYGVDINALLSVAAQEGLSGAVGDNGTSFGPFQLHAGGALPASVWAKGPAYADQWAKSPAGIDYAVQTIKNLVGNQTGEQAISTIVSQFERSADVPTETANAIALYNGGTMALTPTGNTLTPTSASGSTSSAKLFHDLGLPSSGKAVLMPKSTTSLKAGTTAYKMATLKSYKSAAGVAGNPFARKITATKGAK